MFFLLKKINCEISSCIINYEFCIVNYELLRNQHWLDDVHMAAVNTTYRESLDGEFGIALGTGSKGVQNAVFEYGSFGQFFAVAPDFHTDAFATKGFVVQPKTGAECHEFFVDVEGGLR